MRISPATSIQIRLLQNPKFRCSSDFLAWLVVCTCCCSSAKSAMLTRHSHQPERSSSVFLRPNTSNIWYIGVQMMYVTNASWKNALKCNNYCILFAAVAFLLLSSLVMRREILLPPFLLTNFLLPDVFLPLCIYSDIHLINVFVFFILLRTSTWNRLLMESRWPLTIGQFQRATTSVHHIFRFTLAHSAYFNYLARCCCRVYCIMTCTIPY